jgi:hypothetical protein
MFGMCCVLYIDNAVCRFEDWGYRLGVYFHSGSSATERIDYDLYTLVSLGFTVGTVKE